MLDLSVPVFYYYDESSSFLKKKILFWLTVLEILVYSQSNPMLLGPIVMCSSRQEEVTEKNLSLIARMQKERKGKELEPSKDLPGYVSMPTRHHLLRFPCLPLELH